MKIFNHHYRGISNLTADAVIGMTDIVEHLHYLLINGTCESREQNSKLPGIAGSIYQNLRRLTNWANNNVNVFLNSREIRLNPKKTWPNSEALISAVNGVIGDHLLESNNPLAISMKFKYGGVELSDSDLLCKIRRSNGKLLIMVHGLCMNDLQWFQKGKNNAEELADYLGFSAIYVHYNSGLHISENGKKFSLLLNRLVNLSVEPLEITILAHSMGGLVSRSAFYYAEKQNHDWKKEVKNIFFLGTPHHGATLEKLGNWLDYFLSLNTYLRPFASLAKIRSSGITDLRFGNIIDEDWNSECRFRLTKDKRNYVPLPESIKCFSIAASTSKKPNRISDNLIGDGLVSLSSALGRHQQFDLNFPQDRLWVAESLNHMKLLNDERVYQKIKTWI